MLLEVLIHVLARINLTAAYGGIQVKHKLEKYFFQFSQRSNLFLAAFCYEPAKRGCNKIKFSTLNEFT